MQKKTLHISRGDKCPPLAHACRRPCPCFLTSSRLLNDNSASSRLIYSMITPRLITSRLHKLMTFTPQIKLALLL